MHISFVFLSINHQAPQASFPPFLTPSLLKGESYKNVILTSFYSTFSNILWASLLKFLFSYVSEPDFGLFNQKKTLRWCLVVKYPQKKPKLEIRLTLYHPCNHPFTRFDFVALKLFSSKKRSSNSFQNYTCLRYNTTIYQ